MNIRQQLLFSSITILILISGSFLPDEATAATIKAASCSLTDVSTAINSASNGDEVDVPATGSPCTWSSGLKITKGISLIGTGASNVTIKSGFSGGWIISYVPANYSLNLPFRISGFTFDLNDQSEGVELGTSISPPSVIQTKVRVDHNIFTNAPTNAGAQAVRWYGTYGVIDHNTVSNVRYPFRANAHEGLGSDWWNGVTGIVYGDPNYNMYLEDNTIDIPNITNVLSDCQYAGRYAFRYNSITTHGNSYPVLDAHGNSTGYSCFGGEVYGNYIKATGGTYDADLLDQRGGSFLVFYNNGVVNGSWYQQVRGEQTDGSTTNSQPTYVSNSYYWVNRKNTTGALTGSPSIPSTAVQNYGPASGRAVPQLNLDVWYQGTSFDGTSGVGTGTLASMPATCTTGVGYWATNQSTTDLTGMTGTAPSTPISGTLYKCIAKNTWISYYTPLQYPHPLVRLISPPQSLLAK